MLLNSLLFLLVALPLAVLLHGLVDRYAPAWRVACLAVLSLAFYATFGLGFVPLLAASIVVNWLVGRSVSGGGPMLAVTLAVAANLGLLGVFKYLDFFAALVPGLPSWHAGLGLPLGISFFTFQHIMYLRDLKVGRAAPMGLLAYAVYVAFFPRVIAGPLVRASELAPQLAESPTRRPDAAERAARGTLLLVAGLAKKVLIGDALAGHVDPVFASAAVGHSVTVGQAWAATLGYAFQLYFDFSGYTDMALGIALLFGIALPQNFDAPYRAASLQDFWRRWHITLSRFLRDYLYVPFGGNRHGLPRQVGALVATMTLGGLWHGAGLTFVAWGLLHGLGLGANLVWVKGGGRMPAWLGGALTFGFVALAWVLFRAPSFEAALVVYRGLLGLAPLGAVPDLRLVAVAAALAIVGPTAQVLVHRLPPARWVAVGAALLVAAVLVVVGDDQNRDFVYAQF